MHQNILAIIYYLSGSVTGILAFILNNELWIKSLGITILFYFLWHIYEEILKYNERDKN